MFHRYCRISLPVLASFVLLSACTAESPSAGTSTNILGYNYRGADQIAAQVGADADQMGPVLIASLANVNNLDASSSFGRISADEVGSRLTQRGFRVLEARMRSALLMHSGGEFMLSDEIRSVARQQKATTVLVGTYADSGSEALVSLKLIRVADSMVIASSDYAMPVGNDVHEALLGSGPASVVTYQIN